MLRTPISILEKNLYYLKLSVREIDAVAKKLQRLACIERIKCKQCLRRGNDVNARQHAENVARNLTVSTNYMKTSARVDGLIHYFENAINHRNTQKNMEEITKYMHQILKHKDIQRASAVMDRFEKEFENLDLSSVGEMIGSGSLAVVTTHDVDATLQEIIEEAQLDLRQRMPSVDITKCLKASDESLVKTSSEIRK